jgi:hypothetical protein
MLRSPNNQTEITAARFKSPQCKHRQAIYEAILHCFITDAQIQPRSSKLVQSSNQFPSSNPPNFQKHTRTLKPHSIKNKARRIVTNFKSSRAPEFTQIAISNSKPRTHMEQSESLTSGREGAWKSARPERRLARTAHGWLTHRCGAGGRGGSSARL